MKVEISDAARLEADEAYTFYYTREPRAADEFLDAIEEAIDRIQRQPDLFRLIDHEHRRCLVKVYPYAIVYRILDGVIEITAIAHGSRRPGYWQSDND